MVSFPALKRITCTKVFKFVWKKGGEVFKKLLVLTNKWMCFGKRLRITTLVPVSTALLSTSEKWSINRLIFRESRFH